MISERAAEIFHTATTIDIRTREQFVVDSCDGDADLLREVQGLLTATDKSESYFGNLAGKVSLGALTADDPPLPANKVIGPWRLLRRIGRGGMGAVYLAERADEQYEQQVALKILPTGLDTDQARARFVTERQILARLVHDNIARLLDGGVTDDGVPYFAMDYVEGLPIDKYCEVHGLNVRDRLELILDVAYAVRFAHRNLIIHRDLKPSNVLVAEGGRVRLLDFGVAKMLEPDPAETKLTQVAQRPVTPTFASPEMLRGEPVDVTTDVYSIGVLMFELLTGKLPLSYDGLSLTEMYDRAAHVDPPPVSSINARLHGDMDAIVAKALARLPEDRYESVESLATDIRNYLDGLPVEAKAPSAVYRARKFLGRHKLGTAFATFAIVALVSIAGLAIQSAVTADRQAREILLERDRAERIGDFIASIFRDADPYWNNDSAPLSAIDLLRQSEERLNAQDDLEPSTRFELFVTLGQSYTGLQDNPSAIRVLEKAMRIAEEHGVADLPTLADAQFWLSQAYGYVGRDDEGLAVLARAESTVARLGSTRNGLRYEIPLQRAALFLHKGQFIDALTPLMEAIDRLEREGKISGLDMAMAQQMLAVTYRRLNRATDALEAARQARSLFLDIYASEPQHPRIVDATMTYGRALVQVGDYAEGGEMIERATDLTIARFGADSMIAGHFLTSLAAAQTERGDLNEAIENARRGLTIFLREKQSGTLDHENRLRILGNALLAQRHIPLAREYLSDAVDISVQQDFSTGHNHGRAALALALAYSGDFDNAEVMLKEVIQSTEGNTDSSRYTALKNLGTTYRLQGRTAEALPPLLLAITENDVPAMAGDQASAMVEAALAYLAQGDPNAAQAQLESAERVFADLLVSDTPVYADLLVARGRIALSNTEVTAALDHFRRADDFWTDLDPDSRWSGVAAVWLARCLRHLGRTDEATAAFARAERVLSISGFPIDAPLLQDQKALVFHDPNQALLGGIQEQNYRPHGEQQHRGSE
ncbi:MAG: serine/threonine protein kinase [Chromatiales bacterium]|nr:MAG: serine/threonine protein kinase [Chromatiales bacterium]